MRKLLVALTIVPLLLLSACSHNPTNAADETGGQNQASSQPTDPNSPPPGPAWPGPPLKLPENYHEESPEVAAEIAKYFYTSMYYGIYTGDWEKFDAMADEKCKNCKAVKKAAEKCYKDDSAWARGNDVPEYEIIKTEAFPDPHFYDVVLDVQKPSYQNHCTGAKTHQDAGGKISMGFVVFKKDGRWKVEEAGEVKDENK